MATDDSIYWLRAPATVMQALLPGGFHFGWHLGPGGADVALERVFTGELADASVEARSDALRAWGTTVTREALSMRQRPTLWHATPDVDLVRAAFAGRLVEITADTPAEALHQARLAPWRFGIVYHVACMGNWREVVAEQLDLLKAVGLDGVRVALLGTAAEREAFERAAAARGLACAIEFHGRDLLLYEVPSVALLQDWARANPGGYALYFHTKGVSNPGDGHRVAWRRAMQAHVIGRWRENAALLRDGADVVGVGWLDDPVIPHFPGNFYMARADYLAAGCQDFGAYFNRTPYRDPWPANRWRTPCEFWIGTGRPNTRSVGKL